MLSNLVFFLLSPRAWIAFFTWPKFSLTSYRMVSSLVRQGVTANTVIDVGANVGQFAVACSKLFPGVTLHSFEPLPDCVPALKRNVEALGNVRVYPVALGERTGEVSFHVNAHSHSSSILALGERHKSAFPEARETHTITVPQTTLDAVLEKGSLAGPVLLKLDVQGYEPNVLEGATETLKKVDYVLLEASFRPLYDGEKTFMQIAGMMENLGFEFLRPIAWLDDPRTGEMLQADALFARRSDRGSNG